jgi:pSer/pThr/pTyr-binding forkhead associated (FHA) protein
MVDSLLLSDGVAQLLVDGLLIGRDANCDVILPYSSVSREHAAVHEAAGHWYVEDLGSRNGTFVATVRVTPGGRSRLHHGDRLGIASTVLVVWLDSDTDATDATGSIELAVTDVTATLSPYQLQVVRCLAAPWLAGGEPSSNAAIAEALGTPAAEGAIKAVLRRTYAKVDLAGKADRVKRRELCRIARERGWI